MLESRILILVVCDESTKRKIWTVCISELHARPLIADCYEQAVNIIEESSPDLVIIDVSSRDSNEIQICHDLREHTTVPLLLLTSNPSEYHLLEAYQAGVDDCIIKPIGYALLLAKVKVWLYHSWTVQVEDLDNLTVGEYTLEPARRLLQGRDGKKIHLSNLESRVLYLLMEHPNQPLTSEDIAGRVWGVYGKGNSALVKNVIYRLRKKIEQDQKRAQFIRTETGGYLFRR